MSKKIFVLGFFFTLSFMHAQNKNIIDISQYSEEQINKMDQTLPKDGWVLIKMNEEQVLLNYSNKDYVLLLNLDCPNPSYNIEYSSNYRDGDYGGIDFDNSYDSKFIKTELEIDKKKVDFPKNKEFNNFKTLLKKAKVLTMKFYDQEFDPNEGKDVVKLNRSIDFKLQNSELLDEKTTRCN